METNSETIRSYGSLVPIGPDIRGKTTCYHYKRDVRVGQSHHGDVVMHVTISDASSATQSRPQHQKLRKYMSQAGCSRGLANDCALHMMNDFEVVKVTTVRIPNWRYVWYDQTFALNSRPVICNIRTCVAILRTKLCEIPQHIFSKSPILICITLFLQHDWRKQNRLQARPNQ